MFSFATRFASSKAFTSQSLVGFGLLACALPSITSSHADEARPENLQELTPEQKDRAMKEFHACEAMKFRALSTRKASHLLGSLMEIGASIPQPMELVQCVPCDVPANALLIQSGDQIAVAVCQNHVRNQRLLDDALAHELIHLYDYARAEVDTSDPKQLACTEIRASALSGECAMSKEKLRGVVSGFNAGGKFQACIKRKVKLSLSLHEQLIGHEDEIIDQVFPRCFQDQAPFYTFQID